MIRFYRGLIFVVGAFVSLHHPKILGQPTNGIAEEQAPNSRLAAAKDGKHGPEAERSVLNMPCAAGEENRNSELCAQWKAADSAQLAAWLSAASFVTVLMALYLAFRSNAIARVTAHNQLRAYVTLGIVEMRRMTSSPGVKRWFVDVDLENKGQTPAFLRCFTINIGWQRASIAEGIIEPIFGKSREIQVVVAAGKPFGISIEIQHDDFVPSALHLGDKLILTGEVDYLDIYQEPRKSTYRLYADRSCWEKGSGEIHIHTSMTGNTCT